MTDFSYTTITDDDRRSMIQDRIRGLERDHFNISLDAKTNNAPQPQTNDRLAQIEAALTQLHSDLQALTPPAARPAQPATGQVAEDAPNEPTPV